MDGGWSFAPHLTGRAYFSAPCTLAGFRDKAPGKTQGREWEERDGCGTCFNGTRGINAPGSKMFT